jgi:hypothetical protein
MSLAFMGSSTFSDSSLELTMKALSVLGLLSATVVLTGAPLHAQSVDAGVVVRSGPVTGHVEVTSRPETVVREEPVRQVIVVEHMHVPHGKANGWWKKQGYREVTVYSDGNAYYARRFEGPSRLHETVVYQRDGHYYEWTERGAEREHGHGHEGHGHD